VHGQRKWGASSRALSRGFSTASRQIVVPVRLTYEALARNPELAQVALPQARLGFIARAFAWLTRRKGSRT
jgi:hypothetical protein